MKLEVAESLIYSWLRHEKKCTIVQMNWKRSDQWEMMNTEDAKKIYNYCKKNEEFKKYFNPKTKFDQFIGQTEIDVLGQDKKENIYAVDTAFHEYGLRYKNNIKSVITKIIRTALCLKMYFDTTNNDTTDKNFTICFATPKVSEAKLNEIRGTIDKFIQRKFNYKNYKIEFYCNDDFYNKIMFPTIDKSRNNSDTSELFMRSWILYDIRSNEIKKQENAIITFIDHVDEKTRSKTITLKNLEEKFKVNNKKIFSKTKQENFKQIKDRRLYLSIDIIKEKKVDDLEKIKKDFDNFIKDKAKNHVNVSLKI